MNNNTVSNQIEKGEERTGGKLTFPFLEISNTLYKNIISLYMIETMIKQINN